MNSGRFLILALFFVSFSSCTSSENSSAKKEIGMVNKVTDDPAHVESNSILPVKKKAPVPDNILNVQSIINLKEDDVKSKIGEPYASEKTSNGIRKYYSNVSANVEVTFINKKADWIKILPKYEIPFEKESLKYINIRPSSKQTFDLDNKLIMLRGMEEFEEVAIYPDDNKLISYYFIKTCIPAN